MPEEHSEDDKKQDTDFGAGAVGRGFVTEEQVKQAAEAQQTILKVGLKKSLSEIMIEKGLMTKQQAGIVDREVESGGKVKFIGQYELMQKLGEGGMGVVYKARDPSLDRLVALKVLPPKLAKDENFVARFQREARMAARLDHVNIVRALAVGEADGYHYFAMEFVEGRSVGEILDDKKIMSEEEATAIVMQIARALKHAWDNKLIHRDIKPDNILVTTEGVGKLADLGLARSTADDSTRMTQTGTAMGTPYYISPEQARGERDIDGRTDIYSLGVTFYHMVSGEVPFQGSTAAVVITKRLTEDPPKVHEKNPQISANASQVIERMMARDREMRYKDPDELLVDLELIADGKPPGAASEMTLLGATPELIKKDLDRMRGTRAVIAGAPSKKLIIGAAAGGAALIVAIAVVLIVVLAGRGTPPSPPPEAVAAKPAGPASPQPASPAVSAEERKRARLEEEAAGQLKAITGLIKEDQVKAALTLATMAQDKYAGTGYGPDFKRIVNKLELQIAEEDRRKRGEKKEAEKKREREKRAEEEYARVTDKMARGQLDAALQATRAAAKEFADTSWPDKFARLEGVIATKLEEKKLAEEKAREQEFKRLVKEGDAALGAEQFDEAVTSYESALKIKDSTQLRRKIKQANSEAEFKRNVASARRFEASDNLEEAVNSYVKALGIRDDAEVRSKIKSLKNLIEFHGLVGEAQAAEKANKVNEALAAYGDALKIAPKTKAAHIRDKIRALEEAEEYKKLISEATAAAAAKDWPAAIASAEKALSVKKGDAAAAAIREKAKKRLSLPPQIVNSIGMKLILVRGGAFKMGSEGGDPDERPVHEVLLDEYYISDAEVTNAEYERFEASHASKRKPFSRIDEGPAVCVSWTQATAFCRWLGAAEKRTYRLPTEAEWERAARGTDGRPYPWGNSPPTEGELYKLNFGEGNWKKTGKKDGHLYCSPVKTYAAGVSPVGCYDMAGNVWEWCLDWYDGGYYAQASKENPAGPPSGKKKVLRGGAWSNDLACARGANRHGAPPAREDANIGFRVVLVVE